MKIYKFGRGELSTQKVRNRLYVSRLLKKVKLTQEIETTDLSNEDALCFAFTSIASVDRLINDLKEVKKTMRKAKLAQLLEAL